MAISLPDSIARTALDVVAWLVTYALHSTVLLAAALIAFAAVTWMARRSSAVADAAPALRECVGKVALLAGVVTASTQLALGIEPFGLRPALTETRAVAVEPVAMERVASPAEAPVVAEPAASTALQPVLPARVSAALPTVPIYLLPVTALLESALRAVNAVPEAAPAAPRPAPVISAPIRTAERAPATFPIWIAAFLGLWAFVSATALVRRLVGCHALGLSLAGREPIRTGRAREIFDGLCARAGLTGVELSVAPGLAAPITRGILQREVCLSTRALSDLSHDELAALLGHEIAHVSRRDPAWLAVFRCIEIVLCLQPLNRVVARRLEDDAELLCDDRAVVWTGDRLPLASCLTEVASWLVPAGRSPRLAVGMATHGARLTRRVERLVDEEHQPDAGRRRPIPTLCAAGVAAAVVVLVPGFAAERAERPLPLGLRLEFAAVGAPADGNECTEDKADLVADAKVVIGQTARADSTAQDEVAQVVAQDAVTQPSELAGETSVAPVLDPLAQDAYRQALGGAAGMSASTAPTGPLGWSMSFSAPQTAFVLEPPAGPTPAPQGTTPLSDVLDALEAEIVALRTQLSERQGGEALAPRLDDLSQRARRLRDREKQLLLLLATTPSNTLLSPDATTRTAEVR